jgi:hypothetical protein
MMRPLALAGVASVGCYRYTPVQTSELAPQMAVRVELSGVAVDRLRTSPDSLTRLVNGFRVNGTVAQLAADSLLLSVPRSYMEANVRLKTQLFDLPLLRSDLQRIEARRLDKKRTTWAAVALGAATAVSISFVLNYGGRSTGSIPKPVDPTDRVIPSEARDLRLLKWSP